MARHRTHSIAFKRQVVQEYLAGETLHDLVRRLEIPRTLIRIGVDKYETGALQQMRVTRHPWRPVLAPRLQLGKGPAFNRTASSATACSTT